MEVLHINIISIDETQMEKLAPLVAEFRAVLSSYKGIKSELDIEMAKEEVIDFLKLKYPVFVAKDENDFLGYIVCRIEKPCLWVEQLYIRKEHRRKGIAAMLFEQAEEIAKSMGEDTVFNYVHPNNEDMIGFLRSKGYTVLNMIEIRRPYKNEKLTSKIVVDKNLFDY